MANEQWTMLDLLINKNLIFKSEKDFNFTKEFQ